MKAAPALAMLASEARARPSSSVRACAALCEHVQSQGLFGHLFSDITLSFCGKDYQLHRIILAQSVYFHSLLSGPWKEHGQARIELQIDDPNVTPEGLEMAFSYMYGVSPVFTGQNVMAVLAAGCFLCLENLSEKSVQFIVEDLRVETFLGYQQLSERHCYGRFADAIRNACWTFLCTHASRELFLLLPKFSLQVLCLLLKSDELWVLSESERYRLSKQALIDWKLDRAKAASDSSDCIGQRKSRMKQSSARKRARNGCVSGAKSKSVSQKASRQTLKQKAARRKDAIVASAEEEPPSSSKEEERETDLRRLQKLWDMDDPSDGNKEESFQMVADLFTNGGIIFAHMDANEVFQAKKELQDAGLPTDAANDSIWQQVLLKLRVDKSRDSHNSQDYSSDDEDDDEMVSDDDDDYDEVDDDDDDESSESELSESDGWSTDHSSQEEADDESNSSDAFGGTSGQACKRLKKQSSSLVCFSYADSLGLAETLRSGDGKRWRTTGGFTWAVKADLDMPLSDFPPFRFGAEFTLKEKRWISSADMKAREVFYGGSMWKIVGSDLNHEKDDWVFGLQCRPLDTWEPNTYQDKRKQVPFMSKLYVKTGQGLRCVTGTAVRKIQHHNGQSHNSISIHLPRKDVVETEPLRISAIVQLIDD